MLQMVIKVKLEVWSLKRIFYEAEQIGDKFEDIKTNLLTLSFEIYLGEDSERLL